MFALDGAHVVRWWITLGAGLAVAVVVALLLALLLRTVRRIDGNVDALWQTATHVARNTATVWTVSAMAERTEQLGKALDGESSRNVAGETET